MDESTNVTAWVNSVLAEAEGETSVDSKISAVCMKLQIMSADLNDELEASMAELLAAAPRSGTEVVQITKSTDALQDELRALEARSNTNARSSNEAKVLLQLERVAGNLGNCEATLVEVARWHVAARDVEGALQGMAAAETWLTRASDIAAMLQRMAQSEVVLRLMPEKEERRATLARLRGALEGELRPHVGHALKTQSGDATDLLRDLARLYGALGLLQTLQREYAAARPQALQRRWFATRTSAEDAAAPLAPWLKRFFDDAYDVALDEERQCHVVFGAESARVVAVLIVRETLAPLRSSFCDRVALCARGRNGVVDVAECFEASMAFAARLSDRLASDADEAATARLRDELALTVGGAEVFGTVDYAKLEGQHLMQVAEDLFEKLMTFDAASDGSAPPTPTPPDLSQKISDLRLATDAFFDEARRATARCGVLTGGVDARDLVRATHQAARAALERTSVCLRLLRAELVVDDAAGKADDSWAYARAAFAALHLAGSLERRLRDHDDEDSRFIREWCAGLAANSSKKPAFAVFQQRLAADAASQKFVTDVVDQRASVEAPFERVGIERALDAVQLDATTLAFELAFAPARAKLAKLSTSTTATDESSPSDCITAVGEHLMAALQHLEFYLEPANEQQAGDAAACRFGDSMDGVEWAKLGEALGAVDSDRPAIRELRHGDARVISDEASNGRERYDAQVGAKLCTDWLVALYSATAATLMRHVLQLSEISDATARQLAADARYLLNVAAALDVPKHAVILHLLELATPATRLALEQQLTAQVRPETPARRLLEKIDATFLSKRVSV
ncbi:Golgi complex component 7-domain-containing protein [Pelagophyceae sp. CCMP2097]|nr:Golgi complex component 7-domain-containing protein [Pelagophyceae sp. CCMP2097]|mmetsp:Transcript_32680/g.112500  ORF Transcript_32680/g.112500 Transcript_32680/m.112500 type:complete len:806 (+) Transcript_32680:93-2510(+)